MRFFNAFPILYTPDLPAATAFYRDLLGFTVTFEFPPKGEPEFVSLELQGGGGLALAAVHNGQTGAHGLPVRAATDGFELCVYTDDVDATVAALRAENVTVLREPENQPWDERMAYVADPDGHPVMICAKL